MNTLQNHFYESESGDSDRVIWRHGHGLEEQLLNGKRNPQLVFFSLALRCTE